MDKEQSEQKAANPNNTVTHTGESATLNSDRRAEEMRNRDEAKIEEFQQAKGNGMDASVSAQIPDADLKGDLAEARRDMLENEYQQKNKQWQEQSIQVTRDQFDERAQAEADELHTATTRPPHELKP